MSYGVEYIFFSVIRGVDPKYKVEGLRRGLLLRVRGDHGKRGACN